jgi:hypothetical protein
MLNKILATPPQNYALYIGWKHIPSHSEVWMHIIYIYIYIYIYMSAIYYFVLYKIIKWKHLHVVRGLIIHISELSDASVNGADLQFFFNSFAELRKYTISFIMSVCPSFRPHGSTALPVDRFL